jgi:membrane-bound metal-dependent hydrolase YbcI (DUF457 family)
MFVGHFAVGFASKRLAPRASEGVLLLAPLFLDVIWPVFLATGLESVRIEPGNTAFTPLDLHDYPYSHSLVTSLGWSVLLALLYYAVSRYRRGALVVAAGVFSHWVLDWITHRPDMPLYPGSSISVGLGLWNSRAGTMIVESLMFVAGVLIYARCTRRRDWIGAVAFWAMVVVLAFFYLSAAFGPPPPSVKFLKIGAFISWIFIPWAWWFDRHRQTTPTNNV